MTNTLLLNMAIEMVDLPWFSIAMLVFLDSVGQTTEQLELSSGNQT